MSVPVACDSSFLLDLYARHRRDPLSVPADWRIAFELGDGAQADDLPRRLIDAYRRHGIREARLDPLDLAPRATVAALQTLRDAVTTDATRAVHIELGGIVHDTTLGAFATEIHRLHAGTAALEAAHLDDDAQRDWLYAAWEREFTATADPALAERAHESIASADCFENFLHLKFPTKKRFGIEGAESTIVFLREVLRGACLADTAETVIGGMHRGRLCTLATVLGKPVGVLLAEIKGRDLTAGGPDYTGDVPYHLGYAGEIVHGDKRMGVTLAPHPSHLMTVAPVVTGLARARRDAGVEAMCLLMHTDAAFSGQGLVSEVLQLGGLAGYMVGGTIHLVVDNQIGFTTLTSEARSSLRCTDIGKAVGAPVLHVNADDPFAVARVARVALAWRQAHGRDVVTDLVCYRRNGHNELDEPRFTQPRMWDAIDAKPALHASFGARMADAPAVARAESRVAEFRAALQRGYEGIDGLRVNDGPRPPAAWSAIRRAGADALHAPVTTGMDLARLRALGLAASTIPDSIAAHPKVKQFYRARRASIEAGAEINFATAEALAFASLLADGVSVRLSGQDSVRGTFT